MEIGPLAETLFIVGHPTEDPAQGRLMAASSDAESRLNKFETEFLKIQEGLKFPYNLADKESLTNQSESVLTEARNLCNALRVPLPSWVVGARRHAAGWSRLSRSAKLLRTG